MKFNIHHTMLIPLCAIAILSCSKDNYKPPTVPLTGALTYKGEPLQLINSSNAYIGLQIYQYGFGKIGAVNEAVTQDGKYAALLYAGNYKLTIPNGQVPFKWPQTVPGVPDSISIALTAAQTLNIEVMPYWMVRTPTFTASGGSVTATFKAEQIITDATAKSIDKVALFINKTELVSDDGNQHINEPPVSLAGAAITDLNNISLSTAIPTNIVPAQNYIFARVGIKMNGIDYWIFSPVQKVSF